MFEWIPLCVEFFYRRERRDRRDRRDRCLASLRYLFLKENAEVSTLREESSLIFESKIYNNLPADMTR